MALSILFSPIFDAFRFGFRYVLASIGLFAGNGDKWHKDLLAAVPDLRDFSAILSDDNRVHIG